VLRQRGDTKRSLSYCSITFHNHFTLVVEVTLEYVGVVTLMHLAGSGVGRQRYGNGFVVGAAFVAAGGRVAAFGVCHNSVYSFQFTVFSSLVLAAGRFRETENCQP
jgi:hypothetical protein